MYKFTRGSSIALALTVLVLLSSCSGEKELSTDLAPAPKPEVKVEEIECLNPSRIEGSIAGSAVRTSVGVVLQRNDALVLDNSGAERVLARNVDRFLGVAVTTRGVEAVIVEYSDGESAMMIAVEIKSGVRTELGAGEAPEYRVTQIAYDAKNDQWVLTAIADLTEVIARIDGSTGVQVGDTFEPYGYNQPPFVAGALPYLDGYLVLQGPEFNADGGVTGPWRIVLYNSGGEEVAISEWKEEFGVPTGEIDNDDSLGMYIHTEDGRDGVAIVLKDGSIRISSVCTAARGRWLDRR